MLLPLDSAAAFPPATAGGTAPAIALVGCAGWSVPKQSADRFAVDGSHLERYAGTFGAVEINSAFYRHHRPATYARWAASTPPGFRFSVKLPRAITHEGGLDAAAIDAVLARFAAEVGALGDKLGAILVQLPPKLAFDGARAAHLFVRLRHHFACLLCCEARHPSWFEGEATALLREHGISRVIADPPAGQRGPHVPTAAAIYLRLHGAPRVYYSSYDEAMLAELGRGIAAHVDAGRQVWCIFDNTLSASYADQAWLVQDTVRARLGRGAEIM